MAMASYSALDSQREWNSELCIVDEMFSIAIKSTKLERP